MNQFESELKKIIDQGSNLTEVNYVGRVCYGKLNNNIRAKIAFVTCGIMDHYEGIRITLINKNDGEIDRTTLLFKDVLGHKKVSNPNFTNGIDPYLWNYNGTVEWYVYKPAAEDYRKLADTVNTYIGVFKDPESQMQAAQTDSPTLWQY
jgi:hypothetical protein